MRIDAATQTLSKQLERTPTPAELADHLETSVEEVLEGLEAATARNTRSIDAPVARDEDEAVAVVETLGKDDGGYAAVDDQLAGENADLDERELRVLKMRLGRQMTQAEIGEVLGVSQMQVSRISRRAVWKLLHAVRGEDGPAGAVPSVEHVP